ncbi:MAG: helix-turn-helix domain-containing protein [Candidatus Pacearchaeota archaeon]
MSEALSKPERRLLVSLIELGESKAGRLSRRANIATSNLYPILESLIDKGLVNYKIKNNTRIFEPSKSKSIERHYSKTEKELEKEKEELLEHISKAKSKQESQNENYKYFEGINGVKSMWDEINSLLDKNSTIKVHTGRREGYDLLVGFYDQHQKIRKKKQAKEKMIFPKEDKNLAKKRTKDKDVKIRFMELENSSEWGTIKDCFFIQYITSRNPKGFLIRDEMIAKTFEQVFDKLWDNAES